MDEKEFASIEAQYERAQGKQSMYWCFFMLMIILAVVGYLADEGFVLPAKELIPYLPLNFGVYGCQGIAVGTIVLVLGAMLYIFVTKLREGSLLGAIFMPIACYILVMGILTGVLEMIFLKVSELEIDITMFRLNEVLARPIPGPSETLEVALWCFLLYDVPFFLFIWRYLHHKKVCAKLEEPAAQAKAFREEKERQQAEEKARQRQARKEQKERERRAREERERRWYAQYEAEQEKDFDFFAGCTTPEQLDTRYKGLMRAYHPDKSSGDLEVCQKINAQYQEKKDQMDRDDEKKNTDKDGHDSEES